jgi:hypothetical protein
VFVGNKAVGGDGGSGGPGGTAVGRGGDAAGGAIQAQNAVLNVAFSAFTGNQAIGGHGGNGDAGTDGHVGGQGLGGALDAIEFA